MKGIKKENLPSKICITCNKPFTWRKKWEKNWKPEPVIKDNRMEQIELMRKLFKMDKE
jgi:hypothetical protein